MKKPKVCRAAMVFTAVVVMAAGTAQAETYEACKAGAGGVTTKLMACGSAELKVRDAMLNQTYMQVLNAVPVSRQNQLRTAERAWVAFRDAECSFRMSAEEGGSDAPLVYNACRIQLTNQRTQDLKSASRVASF